MQPQIQPQTPVQPQQAGSNPPTNQFVAKDGTQLDPTAATLTRAIRQAESGGNYDASGDKGTSKGAYQFNGNNFKAWAKEQGQNPDDFSPENQDKVAYTRIKKLLDKGHTQSEVASIWNSGSPIFEGKKGYNAKLGISYDVPAYVEKVKAAYQQNLQPQGNQFAQNQAAPSAVQPTSNVATAHAEDGTATEPEKSTLGKIVDFAFPILDDIKKDIENKSFTGSGKSVLQQIGDLGLSALWFAPGIGQGAGAAIKAAGLLGGTGAKIAGHALGGTATGYAADVATNLSKGKEVSESLAPGLGTVTGGVLGGALGKIGSKYSQEGVIKELSKGNNNILGQTKRGANELAESFAKGKDTGNLLASKGINLANSINPETIAYDTLEHSQNLRKDTSTLNEVLSESLKRVPGSATVSDLEQEAIAKLSTGAKDKITAAEQAQLVTDEFAKVRAQYGEQLSASDLNDLKHRAWDLSKFDMNTPTLARKTYRVVGNTLKEKVENIAKEGGLDGVKEMNEYMGSHLDAADALERLNGTKAKGGRLGDMMQKHTLGVIGGVGGAFGGGPVGSLIGALTGEIAGSQLAKILRSIRASPIKSAILARMEREDPEIVQKMLEYAKTTPKGLEALKEQLKQQGIPIFNKMEGKQKVSPALNPKQGKTGLLSNSLTAGASRMMAGQ